VQHEALQAYGCGVIYSADKGETIDDVAAALRKGDTVCVLYAHLIAPPRKSAKDKPREMFWQALHAIEDRGATLYEVKTGRSTAKPRERDAIIRDALEHIASAGRAAAGRKNGRRSKGRPPRDVTVEIEAARAAWFDIRHATNDEAIAAGPKGWTLSRYYRTFRGSGR
jgi:hypothetical protein